MIPLKLQNSLIVLLKNVLERYMHQKHGMHLILERIVIAVILTKKIKVFGAVSILNKTQMRRSTIID